NEHTDLSLPGSQARGANTSPSELKSLPRKPVAARPWTALLRGRRLRLPWRIASGSWQSSESETPNVSAGKRVWRTPTPNLSLLDRKVEQGLFVTFRLCLLFPLYFYMNQNLKTHPAEIEGVFK